MWGNCSGANYGPATRSRALPMIATYRPMHGASMESVIGHKHGFKFWNSLRSVLIFASSQCLLGRTLSLREGSYATIELGVLSAMQNNRKAARTFMINSFGPSTLLRCALAISE